MDSELGRRLDSLEQHIDDSRNLVVANNWLVAVVAFAAGIYLDTIMEVLNGLVN